MPVQAAIRGKPSADVVVTPAEGFLCCGFKKLRLTYYPPVSSVTVCRDKLLV